MKLGKTLFGYKRATVDKLIKDYEGQIQRLNEDNEYLKEKLEESMFMYQTTKTEYEKKIDELISKKEDSYNNKLFQQTLNLSRDMIDKSVNKIISVKEQYETVIDIVEKEQVTMEDKFYELVTLVGEIQLHINEMNEKAKGIKETTKRFDVITNNTINEFEKMTRSINKKTGFKNKGITISFAEFLDNYTGEGSIVDILKLYAELYS